MDSAGASERPASTPCSPAPVQGGACRLSWLSSRAPGGSTSTEAGALARTCHRRQACRHFARRLVFRMCSWGRGREPEPPPRLRGHTPFSAFSTPACHPLADGFHPLRFSRFASKRDQRKCPARPASSPGLGSPGRACSQLGGRMWMDGHTDRQTTEATAPGAPRSVHVAGGPRRVWE